MAPKLHIQQSWLQVKSGQVGILTSSIGRDVIHFWIGKSAVHLWPFLFQNKTNVQTLWFVLDCILLLAFRLCADNCKAEFVAYQMSAHNVAHHWDWNQVWSPGTPNLFSTFCGYSDNEQESIRKHKKTSRLTSCMCVSKIWPSWASVG